MFLYGLSNSHLKILINNIEIILSLLLTIVRIRDSCFNV